MQMLILANPAFAVANPPRLASSLSGSSPRRSSGRAQASPPPAAARSARAAGFGARRALAISPRPPMATAEDVSTGAGDDVAGSPEGFLSNSRAFWVTESLIAWDVSDQAASLCLYSSRGAMMSVSGGVVEGYDFKVELQPEHAGLPTSVSEKFPFISCYRAFRVPGNVDVASLLKCQLLVASFDAGGNSLDVTGLQLPGVLDDMFAYTGPLGAVFTDEAVTMFLWAPTAQDVSISFYDGPMGPVMKTVELSESNGVWSVTGPRSWENQYYLYEVTVYHPATSQVEKSLAVDPYARGSILLSPSENFLCLFVSQSLGRSLYYRILITVPMIAQWTVFLEEVSVHLHIRILQE